MSYSEWCPRCGAKIVRVTRGIPSIGTCENGHMTDRRDVLRRDPKIDDRDARIKALEADLNTAIAAAYEAAARKCDLTDSAAQEKYDETYSDQYASYGAAAAVLARRIRALTPADAIAERDADRARVRREAWLECADWIEPQRNDRPANGSEFAAAIRAMIEEEGNG